MGKILRGYKLPMCEFCNLLKQLCNSYAILSTHLCLSIFHHLKTNHYEKKEKNSHTCSKKDS